MTNPRVSVFKKATLEEIIFVAKLKDDAYSAKVAAEVIRKTYFPVGHELTEKIEIFQYGDDKQYLTNKGVWQARYKDWSYDVECTEEGIFKFYKKAFLILIGLDKTTPDEEKIIITKAREKFRFFMVRTDHKMRGWQ